MPSRNLRGKNEFRVGGSENPEMGVQRATARCRGVLGVPPKHKTPLIEGWGGAPTEREWGEAVTRPPKTEFLLYARS